MQLVWGASTALATAARNTAIARCVLLLASRNGKVIFPSWPRTRRRICPLHERSARLPGTLFLGTRSQA
jgi:hypothetical protein